MTAIRISPKNTTLPEFFSEATSGEKPMSDDFIRKTFTTLLPRPRGFINLDVSTLCNLKCHMCPLWGDLRKQNLEPEIMDYDLFRGLLGRISRESVNGTISLTPRGELFCHPRALDICRAVRNASFPLTFITNGTLMDDDALQELYRIGTQEIRISVDALLPETYEAIRGKDKLRNVVNTIQALCLENRKREKQDRIDISLNFVLQDLNASEVFPFIAMWGPHITRVSLLKWNTETDSPLNYRNRNKQFPKPRRYPCVYPWYHMSIDVQGSVYPCCADGFVTMNMGSVKDSSIKDVWTGEPYMALRRAHLANDFSDYPTCAGCSMWNLTIMRNPVTLFGIHAFIVEDSAALSIMCPKTIPLEPFTWDQYLEKAGALMKEKKSLALPGLP